jgi:hypothetical protein
MVTTACPDCGHTQEVKGSIHTCSNDACKLIAPSTAFRANGGSSNILDGRDPRAWTISGSVD